MQRAAAIGLLLSAFITATIAIGQRCAYQPAEVTSAGDAYVPYQTVVDGLFVLDVSVDRDGEIEKIDALRDPGAMLGAAKTSVRSWKFQPGRVEGQAVRSRMTVSVLYRPPNNSATAAVPPSDFAPVLPREEPGPSGRDTFTPIGILGFAYPEYPVNSVAWGSVVVQFNVDEEGAVKNVEFLHRMAGFDGLASEALKKWRLSPAALNGKPIESKSLVAFVFQTPS